MAVIEIDEADIIAAGGLGTAKANKALLDKIAQNPATRGKFLELVKEIAPNVSIPEIDAAKPIVEKLTAFEKRIDERFAEFDKQRGDRDAKEAETRVKGEIDSNRKKLRSQGWTDEGITNVEKLMTERGITDYEIAAAAFEKMQPPAEPVLPTGYDRSWHIGSPDEGDKMHDGWLKDANKQKAKEVADFFAERRAARR